MDKKLVAEGIGTFILVFAGCGAIVVEALTGALGHVGIALTFGFVVTALIYTFGHVSGAHFNPAVTISFAGLAIGFTVGLEAMFAGPICGASMNPARSIGPAIVSGNLESIWLYIAAPILGALVAGVLYTKVIKCKNPQECEI